MVVIVQFLNLTTSIIQQLFEKCEEELRMMHSSLKFPAGESKIEERQYLDRLKTNCEFVQ